MAKINPPVHIYSGRCVYLCWIFFILSLVFGGFSLCRPAAHPGYGTPAQFFGYGTSGISTEDFAGHSRCPASRWGLSVVHGLPRSLAEFCISRIQGFRRVNMTGDFAICEFDRACGTGGHRVCTRDRSRIISRSRCCCLRLSRIQFRSLRSPIRRK